MAWSWFHTVVDKADSSLRLARGGAIYLAALRRRRHLCMLPWVHLHAGADGVVRPCCVAEQALGDARTESLAEIWNGAPMRQLRLTMLRDEPVAACEVCYARERAGFPSLRTGSNLWYAHRIRRLAATAADGSVAAAPTYLDIRFSNLCNMRCRTCGPLASTQWYEDARALDPSRVAGQPQALIRSYSDLDKLFGELEPWLGGLEVIYFAGGEPLIQEEHYRLLAELRRRKLSPRLSYNTNFSRTRLGEHDAFELWRDFQVEVAASIDGAGARGEYLRKGLSWDGLVAERRRLARVAPRVRFSIQMTLSALNALHLPDFHRRCVELGLIRAEDFSINLLQSPAFYSLQVLPPAKKRELATAYAAHRAWVARQARVGTRKLRLGHQLAGAIAFADAADRGDLLPELRRETLALDARRGESFADVFPELAGLFL